MIVHLVTDRPLEDDDGEGTDLVRRLALAFPRVAIEVCAVPAGDTLAAGFCVAQLACAGGPDRRLVACWVGDDPAAVAPGPWPEGAGARLCVGRGAGGTLIVGPNAGWCWSLALPDLRGLCFLDVAPAGRDTWGGTLATAVAHAHCCHPHVLAGVVDREHVPAPPVAAVAHVDRHGTLKTTIIGLPARLGQTVDVRIGAIAAPALVSDDGTAEPRPSEGELLLAPATSQWPAAADLGPPRYAELRAVGGSAADRFARPPTGTPIAVTDA
ncbi:hypothetical protein [Baekduia sp. Peel2402]|uniref:hypothetical protein n=1 Tax=Baekduia sp. Peel2402 TaxID=3458296 RepID=UPI00403E3EC1